MSRSVDDLETFPVPYRAACEAFACTKEAAVAVPLGSFYRVLCTEHGAERHAEAVERHLHHARHGQWP